MYAHRSNKGTELFKAKGLTINHVNNDLFQLEVLEAMVRDTAIIYKVVKPLQKFRIKGERNLTSRRQEKLFRFTFDERNVIAQYCTIPFDFCKSD